MQPVPHPHTEELRKECYDLRQRLRIAVSEMFRLSNEERPRLTAIYDTHFGSLERELQQLAIRSAEAGRRVELLSIKLARGETITPEIVSLVNSVVDKEYARFHQRLRDVFERSMAEREQSALDKRNDADDNEIARMYRVLVKHLHPDTTAEPLQENLWHQVQAAYQERNAARLKCLLLTIEDRKDNDLDGWLPDVLQQEVDRLRTRVRIEERKLKTLLSEEPFAIADQLEQPAWISHHHGELVQSVAAKKNELAQHERHYTELTGNHLPDDVQSLPEDARFDKDFMDNTYFNSR